MRIKQLADQNEALVQARKEAQVATAQVKIKLKRSCRILFSISSSFFNRDIYY